MEFCSLCNLTDEHDVDGTNWIQCQQCHRWFHQQCLKLNEQQFKEAADNEQWVCPICESVGLPRSGTLINSIRSKNTVRDVDNT